MPGTQLPDRSLECSQTDIFQRQVEQQRDKEQKQILPGEISDETHKLSFIVTAEKLINGRGGEACLPHRVANGLAERLASGMNVR